MIYRLYIYNTKAVEESAPAIGYINLALRKYYTELWKEYDVANFMEYFDVEKVKSQIESELQDKCKVFVHFPPGGYEQKGYLCIVTSYDRIHEALPRIHAIAMENGLALYDAEARKCFFKSLVNSSLVLLRTRSQTLVRIISKKMTRVWKIRKLYEFPEDNFMSTGYVITLKKDLDKTFQERVKNFYNCLKNGLRDDEELKCDKEAFIVSGKQYSITFCLEGYKKFANMKGFYMNGLPSQALLRRMSIEQAFKCIENCSDIEENDIQSRMHFAEMEEKFPNPADRFVESVNITKWQRKQIFSIRYSGFGYYGSEILFHIVPDDFYKDTARISVLKIEEESASYILPFIHDIYPYFYKRYWLTENHLPTEMWRKIIERIKEEKNLILYNTYCPEAPNVAASVLRLLLENGGRPDVKTSDGPDTLFEYVASKVSYDEYTHEFFHTVQCWLLLIAYGGRWEDGEIPLTMLHGYTVEIFKDFELFDFEIEPGPEPEEKFTAFYGNWTMHIFNKETKEEVALF